MNWLSQIFGIFRPLQCWIVIAPWEAALRVRLGKVAAVLGPGFHWRVPFVDRIFVQATRLRMISDSGQTIETLDRRVLSLAVVVQYAIADIRRLYLTVNQPESTLLHHIQGVIAQTVALSMSQDLTPQGLGEQVTSKTPSAEWGLSDVSVKITNFAYVKAFRLLNYEHRSLTNANDLEESGKR